MKSGRTFGICLLSALVVHAAVLGLALHRSVQVGAGAPQASRTVQVRELREPTPRAAVAAAAAKAPRAEAGRRENGTVDPLARSVAPPSSAASAQVEDSTAPAAVPEGARQATFDYVPREFLSLAPAPLSDIDVPFPDSVKGEFKVSVRLALYIDEAGVVQRVRLDGPAQRPALEEAALNVFRQARFRPGEVDGQIVRSLIRVEVKFESERIDALSAASNWLPSDTRPPHAPPASPP